MLYWIFQLWSDAYEAGESWAKTFSVLRLLGYITVRAGLAAIVSFGLTMVFGPRVIRKLISLKVGQPIRTADEVHKLAELHGGKAGTPTMGGIMILGSVMIAVLLCGNPLNPFVLVTSLVTLALGVLGFLDDYQKVAKKNSAGVSGRLKLVWQATVGLAAGLYLCYHPDTSTYEFFSAKDGKIEADVTSFSFPLLSFVIPLSVLAIPFFMAILMGTSNAVNLTDGMDGLAIGCSNSVAIAYLVMAYAAGHYVFASYLQVPYIAKAGELTVFFGCLLGAGLGFLWFNCHPARVFMGDTGSLALGGAIATGAILIKQELVLVIVGGVFVMEALSVVLQVASFKLTGKRIFRCAPIHHHFEILAKEDARREGRDEEVVETMVTIRFWILSIIFAILGIATLKIR